MAVSLVTRNQNKQDGLKNRLDNTKDLSERRGDIIMKKQWRM